MPNLAAKPTVWALVAATLLFSQCGAPTAGTSPRKDTGASSGAGSGGSGVKADEGGKGGSGEGGTGGKGGEGGQTQPPVAGGDGADAAPAEDASVDDGAGSVDGGASTDDGGAPAAGGGMSSCKRTVMVSAAETLAPALTGAMPGDCVVLADGTYTAPMAITVKGTADALISVRAANRGKVTFTADVNMMGAAYVELEGFVFTGMASVNMTDSNYCRITRSRFAQGVARTNGTSDNCRIDHNDFGPKDTDGHEAQATGMSTNTRMDHNYFHDVSPSGGNGRDTVSLGCCGPTFDYHETGNLFEYNLLVSCSGEAEIISIKSSKNTLRYNTIRRSSGTVTLRAGRQSEIYGNFIFGEGKGGGIRVYEDDHKIYDNYVEVGQALQADGGGAGHAPVQRAIVVHNTFVGGVALTGNGNVFANNIVVGGGAPSGTANLTGSADAIGLARDKDGVLAITAMSKAIDAAMGSYPFVVDDINGQPRNKPDIGADEWSSEPVLRRVLTTADVGPDSP